MENIDICSLLRSNRYPGRGLFIGRSLDNNKATIAYFIMGRSENSRNRIFVPTDDGIRTQAHDPGKMTDSSLIIYHPVRRVDIGDEMYYVVSNGDQTDTIRDFYLNDKNYADALLTRTFEPDAPNFTPRISAVLLPHGSYMLSILKLMKGTVDSCSRQFFVYDTPAPGTAHFIHTYIGDGTPLPAFEGEPVLVALPDGNSEQIAQEIWKSLDSENKVSLYLAEVDIKTGNLESMIIKNKNNGD